MNQIRKAIAAALGTGATVFAATASLGEPLQLVAAVGAALLVGAVVYLVPNAPA